MNLIVSNRLQLAYNTLAMLRSHPKILTLVVLLALCCVSCQKSPTPAELALERSSEKAAGAAPSAASVIKLTPPTASESTPKITAVGPTDAGIGVSRPTAWNYWLMLVAIMLLLFVLSVLLFHGMARRLRQKSFRAHAPTRHADIWASHKPPEFLDP